MATASYIHGDRQLYTWRPPGSPLLYDVFYPAFVYGSGDPGGRHAALCNL